MHLRGRGLFWLPVTPCDVELARFEQQLDALEDVTDLSDAARRWVHHLADTAVVGAQRIRMLVAQPGATLAACDFEAWEKALAYDGRPIDSSVTLYRAARAATLEILRSLPHEAWERRAVHERLGPLTLLELVRQQCDDVDEHLADLRAARAGASDGRVHAEVLRRIVESGRAPTLVELAAALPGDDVAAALRRLHVGHGLVLHPKSTEVWIAHPFSLSPTAVWVASARAGWWAPCIWCAMGIVTLAAPTATIHARLGGEATSVSIATRDGRLLDEELVVHFALPPRDAWHNVVHFCATVLPFRDADEVDAWCARHGLRKGEVVPIARVLDLGRAWYARHLDVDWKKWTVAEAQAIFDQVGLRGPFWRLPPSHRRF